MADVKLLSPRPAKSGLVVTKTRSELGRGSLEPRRVAGALPTRSTEAKTETHMKGIVLAGGSGTRLYPLTRVVSKQLLPIYDKPMVYYPVSTLMLAGIREILIISTPAGSAALPRAAGRRLAVGRVTSRYAEQPRPDGLAQAFIIGKRLRRATDPSSLVLGDNIFYGDGFSSLVQRAASSRPPGATVFGYQVKDPERYGVVELELERHGRLHRGEAREATSRTTRSPACTSTTTRCSSIARRPQALAARRAGDHRRQPRVPQAQACSESR